MSIFSIKTFSNFDMNCAYKVTSCMGKEKPETNSDTLSKELRLQ